MERQPLRKRESLLACDVTDAIRALCEQVVLPLALTRQRVAEQLVILAHTEDDDTVGEITKIARRTMLNQFHQQMNGTSIFGAGYRTYENESSLPIVPVNAFFFRHV